MAEENKDHELAEALRNCLRQKPLNRITVTEIAAACNMNRQSFYYHFKDVYYLAEYMYKSDIAYIMANQKPDSNIEDSIATVFAYALTNKDVILNTISAVDREILEYNLYQEIADMLVSLIKDKEKQLGITLTAEQEKSIADFYKFPIVGEALNWFKSGMVLDPSAKVKTVLFFMSASLDNIIKATYSLNQVK
jgi:AcrR family transcriptional regulator